MYKKTAKFMELRQQTTPEIFPQELPSFTDMIDFLSSQKKSLESKLQLMSTHNRDYMKLSQSLHQCQQQIYLTQSMLFSSKAEMFRQEKKYVQAIISAKAALEFIKKHDDPKLSSAGFLLLATLYFENTEYRLALENNQAALALFSKNQNQYQIILCLKQIGFCHCRMQELEEAKKNLRESLRQANSILKQNDIIIAEIKGFLANIHYSERECAEALKLHHECLPIFTANYGAISPEVASCYVNISLAYEKMEDNVNALKYIELAESIESKIFTDDDLTRLDTLHMLASQYTQNRQYEKAKVLCEKILQQLSGKFESSHNRQMLQIRYSLAEAYFNLVETDKAEQLILETLHWMQNEKNFQSKDFDLILRLLVDIYRKQENYSIAIQYAEQNIQLQKMLNGENSLLLASALFSIAGIYLDIEDFKLAYKYQKDGLDIYEKNPTAKGEKYTGALAIMALILSSLDQYSAALDLHQKVLEFKLEKFSEDSIVITTTLSNMGSIYLKQGKIDSALNIFQQVFKIETKTYGRNHIEVVRTLGNIGTCYRTLCDQDTAFKYFSEALDLLNHCPGNNTAARISLLINIAELHKHKNQYQLASKMYSQVYDMSLSTYGVDSIATAHAMHLYAETLRQLQYYENAIDKLERALKIYESHKDINKALEVRNALSKVQKEYSEMLLEEGHNESAKNYMKLAQENLKTILFANHRLLKQFKNISIFDLQSHVRIINTLEEIYLHQQNFTAIITLYFNETMSLPETFLSLRLYFIQKALWFSKSHPSRDFPISNLYAVEAQIYQQAELWDDAIASWTKAITAITEKESIWQIKLKNCKEQRAQIIKNWDYDIYCRWLHCVTAWNAIQMTYLLNSLNNLSTLSVIETQLSSLMINLRSLLDQSFGRFYKQVAQSPATQTYFPIFNSEHRLAETWKNWGLNHPEYNELYEGIKQLQNFYCFSPQQNQLHPEFWQNAWLVDLTDIANNNKHISLTSSANHGVLEEIKGGLVLGVLKLNAIYTVPILKIEPWSFFKLFSQEFLIQEEDTYKILLLSQRIWQFYHELHYLEDGIVSENLKNEINAAINKKDHEALKQALIQFQKVILSHLPKEFEEFAPQITEMFIIQVMQQYEKTHRMDIVIDVEKLIQLSFPGIKKIFNLIARSSKFPDHQKIIPFSLEDHLKLAFNIPSIAKVQILHCDIQQRVRTLRNQGAILECANLYRSSAEIVNRKNLIWLSLHYLNKAKNYYQLSGEFETVHLINEEIARLYTNFNILTPSANHYAETKSLEAVQEHLETLNKYGQQISHIDKDIYNELEAIWIHYLRLYYQSFKLSCRYNVHLQMRLHNNLADLVIKVKHLLELTFTRFITFSFDSDHAARSLQAPFPCASSVKDFRKQLKAKSQWSTSINADELESKFPQVYQALLQMQPFSFYQKEVENNYSWWEVIYYMCNRLKHESLPLTHPERLFEFWQQQQFHPQNLYLYSHNTGKIFLWDITNCLKPAHKNQALIIYQFLTVKSKSTKFNLLKDIMYLTHTGVPAGRLLQDYCQAINKKKTENTHLLQTTLVNALKDIVLPNQDKPFESISEQEIINLIIIMSQAMNRTFFHSTIEKTFIPIFPVLEKSIIFLDQFITMLFKHIPEQTLHQFRPGDYYSKLRHQFFAVQQKQLYLSLFDNAKIMHTKKKEKEIKPQESQQLSPAAPVLAPEDTPPINNVSTSTERGWNMGCNLL